jgi:hypothetical protein
MHLAFKHMGVDPPLNFVYSLAKPERADQYEVSASFREDDALICKNEKIYFHMQYIGA